MSENDSSIRLYSTISLFSLGLVFIFLSLAADVLGVDRTPGFGMIQMFLLLLGITFWTGGAFIYLQGIRKNVSRSLQASIGSRLAATGLIFAYAAGLADLLSIGTHPHPDYERPFVGWLQIFGLTLGIISILAGLLLFYTSRRIQQSSSMEFLVNGNGKNVNYRNPES